MSARYAVGIDLGTTNCTVGYVELDNPGPIASLDVEQASAPGEHVSQPLLPSFLYLALDHEVQDKVFDEATAGVAAKARASKSPGRVIASAKSWLCHTGVDRRGEILPFGADDEDLKKRSPVDVSAHYLLHLSAAWASAHPDAPLDEQLVVLTVPASFDAVARELTRDAATAAGLPSNLRLLEEPQSALYAWLAEVGDDWRDHLATGDKILVVDVGGGTTDFSLIDVRDADGHLALERVAVGEHILLGGDNMDLALAYAIAPELGELSDWQMRALTHACRAAKERLLSTDDDTHPVVVPSRGRRLVQASLSADLSRELVERVVLEGFLPSCAARDRPQGARRAGLASMGLPYATDAAITRHLAAFLNDAQVAPTVVLFNGGVTHASAFQARVLDALSSWFDHEVRVLEGGSKDLAVARGAASYAQVSASGGLRIKGGTARSYYVGVERAELAIPGVPPRVDALCVAPLGMEEGSEVILDEVLGLYRGERALFRFFSSTERGDDAVGQKVAPTELVEIAPVELNIAGDGDAPVPVKLRARVSAIGTLEFAAIEEEGGRAHELSFDVRGEQ